MIPGAVVSVLLAAAFAVPTVGAHLFVTTAYQCSAVTLTASPASPQPAGTQVTLTAAGTCPNPNPMYEFWAKWGGTTNWVLLRGYSTSNQYVWNSTGSPAATHTFGVWVKDAQSTQSYDAVDSIGYSVTAAAPGNPCTAVAITANPTSVVQASSTHVVITGNGTCPNPNPLYEFWARWSGSPNWVLLQGYSQTNTYNWDSTGALPGTENFGVWVKDTSSNAAYDKVNSTQVTVVPATCPSVTAVSAPTTVVHSSSGGTHIVTTATASGCNGAGPTYAFWLRPASSPKWILLNGFTTTNSYDWNTTGAPVDTYYIGVWAKDGHSSNSYDSVVSTTVTVT